MGQPVVMTAPSPSWAENHYPPIDGDLQVHDVQDLYLDFADMNAQGSGLIMEAAKEHMVGARLVGVEDIPETWGDAGDGFMLKLHKQLSTTSYSQSSARCDPLDEITLMMIEFVTPGDTGKIVAGAFVKVITPGSRWYYDADPDCQVVITDFNPESRSVNVRYDPPLQVGHYIRHAESLNLEEFLQDWSKLNHHMAQLPYSE